MEYYEISEPWRKSNGCDYRNHSEQMELFRHFGSISKFGIFLRIACHIMTFSSVSSSTDDDGGLVRWKNKTTKAQWYNFGTLLAVSTKESLFGYLCWYMQVKVKTQEEALFVIASKLPSCRSVSKNSLSIRMLLWAPSERSIAQSRRYETLTGLNGV